MEKKKTSFQTITIVLLVITLLFCLFKIADLEAQVSRLENSLNDQYRFLMENISDIYDNVDEKLEQLASLLSSVEYEDGELTTDWHTADVKISVVPKVISDDMTIRVRCANVEAELTRKDEAYIGLLPVALFTEDEQILMTITTADGVQTEYLDDVYIGYLWSQYLPSLYHGEITGSATFAGEKYSLDGTLMIDCSPVESTPNVTFAKFELVTELNDQQISREDITLDVLNFASYPEGVYFRDEYKQEYEVQEGDSLAIYLEATDSMGYVHRMLVHYWKQRDGAYAETVYGSETIYDSEGNLLYGKD